MTRKVFWVLAALLWLGAPQVQAEGRRPLLIEGKKTLYQRVLAKPEAVLVSTPGQASSKNVVPFTVFYVYDRRSQDGSDWLEVGYDSHGDVKGWIKASQSIDWDHGLTVAFRDPAGHDRVMLFREPEQLQKLAEATVNDPSTYDLLYQAAAVDGLQPDSPVVAIQPKGYVDIRDDFYLVPIREYKDVYVGAEKGRLLRISSVPHNSNGQAPVAVEAPVQAQDDGLDEAKGPALDTGVVFVIDSTLSMDPYIARTRAAIQKIYDDIAQNDPQGNVSFGLVAFRSDPSFASGIEYRSLVYADLLKGRSASDFFSSVAELKAATVSTRDFREDSFAGVKQAIDSISWGSYQARYIILITDAPSYEGSDPSSGTGMSADALRQLARDNNIAIFVLHLKTTAGSTTHDEAKQQYKALSYVPGIGDLYYGVRTGAVGDFGRVLDALGAQLVAQMRRDFTKTPTAAPGDDAQLATLQEKAGKLGYALRMQYLAKKEKGTIPTVFDAWIVDRDLKSPERKVVDVRVLLTRDQLSDLYQMLSEVLDTAEQGMLSPRNFLGDIKTLAATASRDANQLGGSTTSSGAKNLAELGFITEYIEDLPYTGDVMNVTLTDWRNWPAKRQLTFIQRLEEKVNYYRALHDHTDLWVSLDGGPVDGDSVFPVPLEMLP